MRITAVAVAAAVALGTLVGCSSDDGAVPGTAVGELDRRPDGARSVEVRLPTGVLTIVTGAPERSPDVSLRDGSTIEPAADGAVYVPVAWALAERDGPFDVPSRLQYSVTLVADGRRYDLRADQPAAGAASLPGVRLRGSTYVVVAGDGSDLSYEVGYDGVTQRVDVESGKVRPGRAAPYYAGDGVPVRTPTSSCAVLSPADAAKYTVDRETVCTIGPVALVPWVDGRGWVTSTAARWAVVPLELTLFGVTGRGDRDGFATSITAVSLRVDGRPATEIRRDRTDPDSFRGLFVAEVGTTVRTVTVSTVVSAEYARPGAPRELRNVRTYELR